MYSDDDENIQALDYLKNETLTTIINSYVSMDKTITALPEYFAGLLCLSLNSSRNANKYFKKGHKKNNPLCSYRYGMSLKKETKRKNIAEALEKDNPGLALLLMESFSKEVKDRIQNNKTAGDHGILKGYTTAGILEKEPQEKFKHYRLAAKNHLLSAYHLIGKILIEQNKKKDAKNAYRIWGEAGDNLGFITLASLLLKEDSQSEKAQNYLRKAGLRGLEKRIEIALTSDIRNKLKKELIDYKESMIDLIRLHLTQLKGSL